MVESKEQQESEKPTELSPEEMAEQKRKDEEKVKMWNEAQTAPENGVFDRQIRIQKWN